MWFSLLAEREATGNLTRLQLHSYTTLDPLTTHDERQAGFPTYKSHLTNSGGNNNTRRASTRDHPQQCRSALRSVRSICDPGGELTVLQNGWRTFPKRHSVRPTSQPQPSSRNCKRPRPHQAMCLTALAQQPTELPSNRP